MPNAETYAKKVQMTDLDMDMADADEEKQQLEEKKSSHVWRGLRLASKTQLSSFDKVEHGKGLEALQPAKASNEATGPEVAAAPTSSGSDEQGLVPQSEHQSVEERRAGKHSQVTADSAAAAAAAA